MGLRVRGLKSGPSMYEQPQVVVHMSSEHQDAEVKY